MRKNLFAATVLYMLTIVVGVRLSAQELNSFRIGTFHSTKGIGLSFESIVDELNFDSLSILADMNGVLTGEHSTPGLKVNYSRNIIFRSYEREESTISLYVGPGITAGHIRDAKSPTSIVAGIHGTLGAMISYNKNIDLSFALSTDIAFKLLRDHYKSSSILGLYRSGVYRTIVPEIRIQYRFR